MYHLPVTNWVSDNSDEDSYGEAGNVERVSRQPYTFFRRFNMNWLDDEEFFARFRLTKETVVRVLEMITPNLHFDPTRSRSITPLNQLLIALRFFACGNFQITVGDFIGCSRTTICVILPRVSAAIARLLPNIIRMPETPTEMRKTSLEFYRIAKFPGVIGAIDCTHVRIQSPGTDQAENYRNRKGWFSINVQTVVDAKARITNIVARWPGSTHDATIFNNSRLFRRLESGEFGSFLLVADGGYRNTEYMVTPHLNPQTAEEQLFNCSHISTRNVVERSYGILKRRWPVLSMGMRVRIRTVQSIIVACAVLHNIASDACDSLPDDEIDANNDEMVIPHEPVADSNNGTRNHARDRLTREYFHRLLMAEN